MDCQVCRAKCCSIFFVTFTKRDIKRTSDFLNLPEYKFKKKYLESEEDEFFVRYRKIQTGEKYCIFIEDDFTCRIYEARPKMCREFYCAHRMDEDMDEGSLKVSFDGTIIK